MFYLFYRHASFFAFIIYKKISATYAFHMCVGYDKQSKPLQTGYDTTYIYDRYYIRTHVYVFLFSVKKCVFELPQVWPWRWPCGGTPYMVFIGPVFRQLLKLVWREYDIVAMNEWKKKCVGLQRTWVSKRTVYLANKVKLNYRGDE